MYSKYSTCALAQHNTTCTQSTVQHLSYSTVRVCTVLHSLRFSASPAPARRRATARCSMGVEGGAAGDLNMYSKILRDVDYGGLSAAETSRPTGSSARPPKSPVIHSLCVCVCARPAPARTSLQCCSVSGSTRTVLEPTGG